MKQIIKGFFVLLLLWFLASALIPRLLPSPLIVAEFISQNSLELLMHTTASVSRSFIALLLAIIFALPLAVLSARTRIFDQWLTPLVYFFYPVPKIALLPLLLLLFGLGNITKVAVVLLVIFFQVFIAIRDAVLSLDKRYFEIIEGFGGSATDFLKFLILPAMLPQLFTALRISFATSLSVLFFAETFFTKFGLGYFIMQSWMMINYKAMFAGIFCLSFLGIIIFQLFDLLEKKFTPWVDKNLV